MINDAKSWFVRALQHGARAARRHPAASFRQFRGSSVVPSPVRCPKATSPGSRLAYQLFSLTVWFLVTCPPGAPPGVALLCLLREHLGYDVTKTRSAFERRAVSVRRLQTRSRCLSLRHTKIMLINPENLRVDQHVSIGDLTLINMCSPCSTLNIEGEIQIPV
jgi:hypothetical protein